MNRGEEEEEERGLIAGDSSSISPFHGGFKNKGNWILMGSNGGEMILSVDKYEIMNRANMDGRDLRIIDPVLSHPSTILVRDKAIVLNLEHIKGIITSEEFLLRSPMDDDIIPVVEELRRRRRRMDADAEDKNPFQFLVLDVTLEAICSFLSARTTELENSVYPALDLLTKRIVLSNMDDIRKLKSQMTRLSSRVHRAEYTVKEEIEKFLGDDDHMAELLLSREAADDERDLDEIEMLLESHFSNIDGTSERLSMVKEYIENTEDYINLRLDNRRNQLIKLELVLRTGDLSMNLFGVMVAIFSMNIPYQWDNPGYGYTFTWGCIVTGVLCMAIFVLIYRYARSKGLIVA